MNSLYNKMSCDTFVKGALFACSQLSSDDVAQNYRTNVIFDCLYYNDATGGGMGGENRLGKDSVTVREIV